MKFYYKRIKLWVLNEEYDDELPEFSIASYDPIHNIILDTEIASAVTFLEI